MGSIGWTDGPASERELQRRAKERRPGRPARFRARLREAFGYPADKLKSGDDATKTTMGWGSSQSRPQAEERFPRNLILQMPNLRCFEKLP